MARSNKTNKSKKKSGGIASLLIMIIGFAIGILIGRWLEFDDFDDDDDDDDFDLDLFSD